MKRLNYYQVHKNKKPNKKKEIKCDKHKALLYSIIVNTMTKVKLIESQCLPF